VSSKPGQVVSLVIINNMTGKLNKESLRFKNIFEQLFFEVEIFNNYTASEMKTELVKIAKTVKDSLIVMIISHGHNENVFGYDKEDLPIADIFSDTNCSGLKRKPKLFFFNRCRRSNSFPTIKNFIDLFNSQHKINI
jgi:hypothetical protein